MAVFIWLAFARTWSPAVSWAFALGISIAATGLLKVLFDLCPPTGDLHSPSGHTSLSAMVYGGLAVLVAASGGRLQRMGAAGAGCMLVGSIAVSRVVLNSHTALETVAGLAIGSVALVLFAKRYFSHSRCEVSLRPLLLSVAILLVVLHGQQLHAEGLFRAVGSHLRADGLTCR
jgi:membrane-associated phospholipid phosphatase